MEWVGAIARLDVGETQRESSMVMTIAVLPIRRGSCQLLGCFIAPTSSGRRVWIFKARLAGNERKQRAKVLKAGCRWRAAGNQKLVGGCHSRRVEGMGPGQAKVTAMAATAYGNGGSRARVLA